MPRGRPFTPGVSGNPKGRKKGIKERHPRGIMKRIYTATMEENYDEVRRLAAYFATSRKYGLQAHELAAKLNKELGSDAALDVKPVVINFFSNLNPMALAGARTARPTSTPKSLPLPKARTPRRPPPSAPATKGDA